MIFAKGLQATGHFQFYDYQQRYQTGPHTHLNKEDEVFEGGVQMGLLLQLDDRVKVLVVDVSIDTEQALQDGLRHGHEVLWEWDTCNNQVQMGLLKVLVYL